MSFLLVLLFFLVVLISSWCYIKWPYDYWIKQGVESAGSVIPGFGHTLSIMCSRESLCDICTRLYRNSTSSMIGLFHLSTPVLIVREPELIRTIQVKEFINFRNNITSLDENRDWFTAKHPFFAVDDTWKECRTRFASGMSAKKLKIMFEAMQRVSIKFEDYLDRIDSEIDLKQLCLRFTSEFVCNAGFGIEYNRTFATMSAKIFEYTWANTFKHLFNFFLPGVARTLRVNFETEEMRRYFGDIAKSILENDKGENFVRMTMETSGEINLEAATALVSGFYIDASATVASAVSMVLFRLSKHPEIQERLRDEILETLDKHDGKLSYEVLKEMSYLQQVINETMRLHPILEVHGKICTGTVTIRGSDGQSCTLQPGNVVIIPTLGLHTDERYWRDPEQFDPDRFADDRRDGLTKFAYLPFGEGPRQCPGMRFGTTETKIVVTTILKKYKLVSSDKTNFPVEMDTRSVLRSVKGGLWARLVKID